MSILNNYTITINGTASVQAAPDSLQAIKQAVSPITVPASYTTGGAIAWLAMCNPPLTVTVAIIQ